MSQMISVDDATLASLDAVASARDMSREDALREAVHALADYDTWFQRKAEAGERAYRTGDFISQDEATRRSHQRRIQLLQKFGQ